MGVQLNFRLSFKGKYKNGDKVERKLSVHKHFLKQVTIIAEF